MFSLKRFANTRHASITSIRMRHNLNPRVSYVVIVGRNHLIAADRLKIFYAGHVTHFFFFFYLFNFVTIHPRRVISNATVCILNGLREMFPLKQVT